MCWVGMDKIELMEYWFIYWKESERMEYISEGERGREEGMIFHPLFASKTLS